MDADKIIDKIIEGIKKPIDSEKWNDKLTQILATSDFVNKINELVNEWNQFNPPVKVDLVPMKDGENNFIGFSVQAYGPGARDFMETYSEYFEEGF